MPHYERCANPRCNKVHSPGKFTAVYIRKQYYCKPSCANAHGEQLRKEKSNAVRFTEHDAVDDDLRHLYG